PRRALAQEFFALERRVFDAESDDFLIIAALFQTADDNVWQIRAAERHETFDLRRAQDRQDAGDDRHLDTRAVQMIAEREVVGVLEKELGDDEVRALLDLVGEAVPVHMTAFGAGDMPFGKSGDADGEIAGVADALHELIRVLETAGRRRK